MYRFLAGLYPKRIKNAYNNLLAISELELESNRFLGFIIIFGILLSATISTYLLLFFKIGVLKSFILSFMLIEIIVFVILWLSADRKAKFINKILPEALQIMAANLRAGLTTDRSIIAAARPEFGPLKKLLDKVGRRISLGTDITTALKEMPKSVKSKRLVRTITLITNAIKSGGTLAPVLEQTAEDIRKQDIIDSKIKASIGMYTILIFAAVGIGSPILFGLSTVLVKVLASILGGIDIPPGSGASIPISIGEISLDPEFLVTFITAFIIANSFFGSLLLGMISKGKAKRGLVLFPVFLALGFGSFHTSRILLEIMLGGLFTL